MNTRCLSIYQLMLLPVVILALAPIWACETAEAQNRVRILQSDRLEGVATEEGRVRKLIGNVRLETDDFSIVCDSAWQYLDIDELVAYGNIEIESDRQRIWAEKATYDLISEVTLFQGSVVMQSESALLFSEEVFYSFATEIALFPEFLRLEDERGVLLADSGYYYNALDSAVFRGHVQLADTLQYMEADSLFTNRRDDYNELHGRVFLNDEEYRTSITGALVISDSTGYRRVDGNSRMRRINEAGTDTTFLWSEWLEVHQRDTINTFTAYDRVHIWAESYSSLSDTAHYNDATELFTLNGSPRLWYDEIQITGPRIKIQMEEDSVRYLESFRRPFVVQNDTGINRLNQTTGDTLFIRFEAGVVSFMEVYPNANVIYFIKEGDEADGAIELTAEFIKILFDDGELEDVIARTNVDGTYHPESPDVEHRRLDGFVWEPERRPERPEDVWIPRLPPIPDDRPFDLPERFRPWNQ
ncbi:OstA-like protein [Balneolales bacterium ANBcel1]|nr:OstA-like protein [Balneolales bacterium ANBcel1]